MSRIACIGIGTILTYNGRTICVKSFASASELSVQDVFTKEVFRIPVSSVPAENGGPCPSLPPDLAAIPEEEWDEALSRYRAILPLLDTPARTAAAVAGVAATHQVSVATVYRWLSRIAKTRTVTSLLRKKRKDAGNKKLVPGVDEIIDEVIENAYLKKQQIRFVHTHRDVALDCRKKGLPIPHLTTVTRRLNSLAPELVADRRRGKNEALKFSPIRGTIPGADFPYSLLQIDHTKLDIILVDEVHRIKIGRPYITLVIDVFSRTVAGFYISFDPPGTLATGICIGNAVLLKDEFLQSHDLSYQWPCFGVPRTIHVDNAKEFRGNVLRNTCNQYGIHLQFRPVKRPQYGAHIERLLGTLLHEIHTLPGTTFSNPKQRGEYDSEGTATMTLAEFEKWLLLLICGVYHQRIHSELGMTPLQKLEEGILGTDEKPGVGVRQLAMDEQRFRIDFLPMEERTIQPYGVMIDNIIYQADVLNRWIGAREEWSSKSKRKFIFRRDPRDISYVLFYDPDTNAHYRIPYRDTRYPAITLWELRAVQRHLATQGKKNVDQEQIFETYEQMRGLVNNAVLRKQEVIKKERKKHLHVVPSPQPVASPEPEEQDCVTKPSVRDKKILPFALEE